MDSKWLSRMGMVTTFSLVLAAVCQEMEKPPEARTWNGKLLGFIPYDFRVPTLARIKESYWNPYGKVLTPEVFGLGWTINFYALLENLGIFKGPSEENFLMPNKSIKEVLKPALEKG